MPSKNKIERNLKSKYKFGEKDKNINNQNQVKKKNNKVFKLIYTLYNAFKKSYNDIKRKKMWENLPSSGFNFFSSLQSQGRGSRWRWSQKKTKQYIHRCVRTREGYNNKKKYIKRRKKRI